MSLTYKDPNNIHANTVLNASSLRKGLVLSHMCLMTLCKGSLKFRRKLSCIRKLQETLHRQLMISKRYRLSERKYAGPLRIADLPIANSITIQHQENLKQLKKSLRKQGDQSSLGNHNNKQCKNLR